MSKFEPLRRYFGCRIKVVSVVRKLEGQEEVCKATLQCGKTLMHHGQCSNMHAALCRPPLHCYNIVSKPIVLKAEIAKSKLRFQCYQ